MLISSPLNAAEHVRSQEQALDLQSEEFERTLILAARVKDYTKIEKLLYMSMGIDSSQKLTIPLLHLVVLTGKKEVIRILLEQGADINEQTAESKGTLLHVALLVGQSALVKMLLTMKANVNARNRQHETPLHNAAASGELEMVKILLEAGADRYAADYINNLALHNAAREGKAEVMELLIDDKSIHAVTLEDRYTPLHLACQSGCLPAVQLLLRAGADVNALGRNRCAPIDMPLRSLPKKKDIIALLLCYGAYFTPSHLKKLDNFLFYAFEGHVESVEATMAAQAPENIMFAILLAAREGDAKLLAYLLQPDQ